jgi:hypothetical protein
MRQKTAALRDFEPALCQQSNPITGIAGCCARAASGHAAAAPPRSVMKSRRLMSDMGLRPAQEWPSTSDGAMQLACSACHRSRPQATQAAAAKVVVVSVAERVVVVTAFGPPSLITLPARLPRSILMCGIQVVWGI